MSCEITISSITLTETELRTTAEITLLRNFVIGVRISSSDSGSSTLSSSRQPKNAPRRILRSVASSQETSGS